MKNIRPFQLILLVVFGLVALLGLALFANFRGNENADKTGTVVIWGTLPNSQVSYALTEMQKLHKQFARVSYVERQESNFSADLANAIASGNGPDLVIINQEHILSERGKLQLIPSSTINERQFRDAYLPIFDIYLAEGGAYGIPLVVDPLVLYYNEDFLATVGASRPPATWEAVTGLTPALTSLSDALTVNRAAVALGTYSNIDNARAIISLLFFQSGQQIVESSSQGLRSTMTRAGNTSYGATAAETAISFYTEFANPAKTTYSWNRSLANSRHAFTVGDLALYLGYASERKGIAGGNPNLEFDMASVPQPGTATIRQTYGKAYALVIPKASKNPAGAYETAFALTAADTLPTLARSLGMAPGVRAFLTPSNDDLYEPVYYPEALVARGWLSPAPSNVDAIFETMIDNVNSGRMNVRQALGSAEQALNAILF